MRCLFDASVLLGYLASPRPQQTAVDAMLSAVVRGAVVLLWADALADEVRLAAALRPGLRKRTSGEEVDAALALLASLAQVVAPGDEPPPPACRDPNDDYLVAIAVAGRADLVVTLDDDLLALGEYRGVRFVKPGGALAALREAGLLPGDG